MARAHQREALGAVDPDSGGDATHHVCLAPGCNRHGPSVKYGSVSLTLCPRHKADFDRQWVERHVRHDLAG